MKKVCTKKDVSRVLIAIAAVSLIFASCGPGGAPRTDSLIVVSIAGQPSSLDPIMANDLASAEMKTQIFNTLFDQDSVTMAIMPALAERYQFENDANGQPTLLRVFLRPGVRFHNGDYMTAQDVRFSIERAAGSPIVSHISGSIARAEVTGDNEVLITLRFPFAPILNNLAHPAMSIVSERAVLERGADFGRNPIGTGPLMFVNWFAGNRIELARWDGYFGELPRIREVTIRYISDPATALLELETGGADILFPVVPQDIRRIETDPNLQLVRATGLRLNFIGFNNLRPPLDNVLVRRAIAHAVDKEALVNAVFMGVGRPGNAPITATVWASAAGQLPPREFNPELSRQLLAQAGFPNGFSTTISAADIPTTRDTATILQSMLAQVGINAEILIHETATWVQFSADGLHDIGVHSWTTITGDPDYGLEILHSRSHGGAGNRAFFTNAEVDRLLDAGRVETNAALRQQIYFEVQRIIHEETPWIYKQEDEVVVALRSNIRGFTINPGGLHPFWNVYFE